MSFIPSELKDFMSQDPIFLLNYVGAYSKVLPKDEQSDLFLKTINKRMKDLRVTLMKFVRNRCAVSASVSSLKKTYGPLFNAVSSAPYDVFTTNYDTLIERYFAAVDVDIENGIDENWIFDPSRFEKHTNCPKIVKLHGSIDLYMSSKGIRYSPVADGGLLADGTKVGSCMIYPNLMKRLEDQPFATLLRQFRVSLNRSKLLFVIGHSLRDYHISQTIYEVHRQNNEFYVCIIDPNSKAIINGLPEGLRYKTIEINKCLEQLHAYDLSMIINN